MNEHSYDEYEIYGGTTEHHRHYSLEQEIQNLRYDLERLRDRVGDLEELLQQHRYTVPHEAAL